MSDDYGFSADVIEVPPNEQETPEYAKRFWPKVEKTDTCWLWCGCKTKLGYGRFSVSGRGENIRNAHRVAYTLTYGAIPDGMVLDHLCRNPSCVRPDHLEPVTSYVNSILRGVGGFADKARQTQCIHGHEYTAENTVIHHNRRECRTCKNIRQRNAR